MACSVVGCDFPDGSCLVEEDEFADEFADDDSGCMIDGGVDDPPLDEVVAIVSPLQIIADYIEIDRYIKDSAVAAREIMDLLVKAGWSFTHKDLA